MRGLSNWTIVGFIFLLFAAAPTAFSQEGASVRVTHLSADTPIVDIWIDGVMTRGYLGPMRTTQYLNVLAGEHRIQVRPTGEESVLTELSLNLLPASKVTLGITGLSGQNDLQLTAQTDDAVADFFFAKVRFVHASSGVPAIDIAVAKGGPMLVSNLGYRESSGYIQIRPDVYDLEVRISGTSTVLFTIPKVGVSRAANCTIYTTIEGDGNVLKTVHTFETNTHLDYKELLLGLAFWAALLAWFVKNHAAA